MIESTLQRIRKEEDQNNRIFLEKGKWNFSQKYPKQTKAQKLFIYANQKNILKEIMNIQLQGLRWLYLERNFLQSLQQMGRIHLPHLQRFKIKTEPIRRFKSLKKVYWPQIVEVKIFPQISEPQILSQFYCKSMLWLTLDHKTSKYFLFKVQSIGLRQINLSRDYSQVNHENKTLKQCLQRKFPQIKIKEASIR